MFEEEFEQEKKKKKNEPHLKDLKGIKKKFSSFRDVDFMFL